jgi:hypothetical protein
MTKKRFEKEIARKEKELERLLDLYAPEEAVLSRDEVLQRAEIELMCGFQDIDSIIATSSLIAQWHLMFMLDTAFGGKHKALRKRVETRRQIKDLD